MNGIPPNNYLTLDAKRRHPRKLRGFTIVELLIVVVVIAILAAITIVAYNGVTSGARETALKSDLKNASSQLELHLFRNNSLPADASGLPKSEGTVYAYTSAGKTFCLEASHAALSGKIFHVTEKGNVVSGVCPPPPTTMQAFTGVHCSALPVYTGSNPSAIRSLTDSRGGTTRTYEVAKLADGKCWMLTNLKLGSTTGSITLTPADSNVASNFTLPQLATSGATNYDSPRAYGPVPGDTASGTTNYGYLYNFPAATAGETRTTLTTGNAPYSICPANWRLPTGGLPTGGSPSSDFGQLDVAFGGTGAYASGSPSIAKWQPSGPFKGSFSGYWSAGFYAQAGAGNLWSASAYPGSPDPAVYATFVPSGVFPGDTLYSRNLGIGVRCLLN